MKKTSILTIMIAFIAFSSFAQTPAAPQTRQMPTAEERAKRTADRLNTMLQLTPEQYQKIVTINTDFHKQTEALRTPGQPMNDEARTKMRTLSKEKEDKTNAVLTAEQRAKYEASRKGGAPGQMKPAPGAPAAPAGK